MSKYGNKKAEEDGYTFDSLAEHRRYRELKLMAAAGEIADLVVHPRYPLEVERVRICTYIADFGYSDLRQGVYVVEDVKGVKTQAYRLKKKLYEVIYHPGKITEVAA